MLFEPERTPYDLHWRMLGIPVRVHPFFWLFSAILGWNQLQEGLPFLILWIVCVFVSVLIHELGHIFAGRLFGESGHIVLYSFGGLAVGSNALPSRWQRITVSFAGPAAGFLFCGLVYLAFTLPDKPPVSPLAEAAFDFLMWINLGWGILNLLPIWPLDGGQICREICEGLDPQRGGRIGYGISTVTAGLLALHALLLTMKRPIPALEDVPFLRNLSGFYMVVLFGFLAFNSWQRLQYESNRRPWDDRGDYWRG